MEKVTNDYVSDFDDEKSSPFVTSNKGGCTVYQVTKGGDFPWTLR